MTHSDDFDLYLSVGDTINEGPASCYNELTKYKQHVPALPTLSSRHTIPATTVPCRTPPVLCLSAKSVDFRKATFCKTKYFCTQTDNAAVSERMYRVPHHKCRFADLPVSRCSHSLQLRLLWLPEQPLLPLLLLLPTDCYCSLLHPTA